MTKDLQAVLWPARQLSGGERRRIALALLLGFADLISARGRLRCNLIVLDEVLILSGTTHRLISPLQACIGSAPVQDI